MTVSKPEHQRERLYLKELASRARAVLGEELIGAYAGGSFALGAYEAPRSDLDVAVVIESALGAKQRRLLVERVRHEALPCPARGLELVVYRRATAASPKPARDFELNLNSGASMAALVQTTASDGQDFWFPIDRSILAQAGVAILGPPASEVFASIPVDDLRPVLTESDEWHRVTGQADAAPNSARAQRFLSEGRWYSKPEAERWARGQTLTRRLNVASTSSGKPGTSSRSSTDE
jgi:predicted nucleotidyltransferase